MRYNLYTLFPRIEENSQAEALAGLYRRDMASIMKREPHIAFDDKQLTMVARIAASGQYLFGDLARMSFNTIMVKTTTRKEDTHMADLPPSPDTGDEGGVEPERESTSGTP